MAITFRDLGNCDPPWRASVVDEKEYDPVYLDISVSYLEACITKLGFYWSTKVRYVYTYVVVWKMEIILLALTGFIHVTK